MPRPLWGLGLQQAVPQATPHPTRICKASSSHTLIPAAARHVPYKAIVLSRPRAGGGLGRAQHTWPGQARAYPACEECGCRPGRPGESCHPRGSRPALTPPGWAGWAEKLQPQQDEPLPPRPPHPPHRPHTEDRA